MATKIFVNLHVKNLDKSIEFFTQLGFTFNPKFTDENATCMIIGENIFAMLLVEPFFKSFTKKQTCNTADCNEVILAIELENREKVDTMLGQAIAAGSTEPNPAQDHGWMYSRSFKDPDGHLWEAFYMDESAMPQA